MIRGSLGEIDLQAKSPVLGRHAKEYVFSWCDTFVELGPGKTLSDS